MFLPLAETAPCFWPLSTWYAARYGDVLRMPVPVPVVIQFMVDHAARKADAKDTKGAADLVSELPPDVNQALVANGYKARLGAPALNTLVHRIAVLSKAHQLAREPNPCADPLVRELLGRTRRAYAKRGAPPPAQAARPYQGPAAGGACDLR